MPRQQNELSCYVQEQVAAIAEYYYMQSSL